MPFDSAQTLLKSSSASLRLRSIWEVRDLYCDCREPTLDSRDDFFDKEDFRDNVECTDIKVSAMLARCPSLAGGSGAGGGGGAGAGALEPAISLEACVSASAVCTVVHRRWGSTVPPDVGTKGSVGTVIGDCRLRLCPRL